MQRPEASGFLLYERRGQYSRTPDTLSRNPRRRQGERSMMSPKFRRNSRLSPTRVKEETMEIEYFKSSEGMFTLVEEVFQDYCNDASERDFLLLIFLLTHLRETIAKGKKQTEIEKIVEENRTQEETFFLEIRNIEEFETIRKICNGAKHYNIEWPPTKLEGFTCGIGRCGDHLGQKYFLINFEHLSKTFKDHLFFRHAGLNRSLT